jgi:hypothetical protein
MQYMISVFHDSTQLATPEEMAAIGVFDEQLKADGQWVFAGGLNWPDTATAVDARGEEVLFTDGPFLETKEFLAGFWVVEAPDLDAALALAAAGSKACHRAVEVRPFFGG